MVRFASKIGIIMVAANLACGCAVTNYGTASLRADLPFSHATPAEAALPGAATPLPQTAGIAETPMGFVGFCVRTPDQCRAAYGASSVVALTPATWNVIRSTNESLNDSIWPEDDLQHYGRADYWTIPTDGYGDCEDYALAKRRQLMLSGLPESALRMAVVLTPDGERHAVLTVATDRGDFVLDNLRSDILPWNQTGYTWIERQASYDPMVWVSLRGAEVLAALNDNRQVTGSIP